MTLRTHTPKNIVILTGAGISAESGIDTFRAAGGLWENHRVEDVATPQGFAADPALVHNFYNARRAALKTVTPNPAHHAIARLQKEYSGEVFLVTQNVDNLHERGGSPQVCHMHGELLKAKCAACHFDWKTDADISIATPCPACKSRAARPDIVWFGEMPYAMQRIEGRLATCDMFVSVGTSGAVYPAGGFVQMAKAFGAQALEINLEPSEGSSFFNETRLGKAGTLVPAWVDEILGSG